MLETARRLTLPPATNLPQRVDTAWFHLLPSLAPSAAVVIGDPDPTVLGMLQRQAGRVVVIEAPGRVSPADLVVADLIVVTEPDRGEAQEVASRLAADSPVTVVLLDQRRSARSLGRRGTATATGAWRSALPPGARWRFVPSRRALPRTLRRIERVAYLGGARLAHLAGRTPRWTGKHAADLSLWRPEDLARRPRFGSYTAMGGPFTLDAPPAYLCDLAANHGHDLAGRAWTFGGGRGFRSQKIVFVVGSPDTPGSLVVKATQEPRFNQRLGAEAEALQRLAAAALPEAVAVPQVVFTGVLQGLLHVAETMLAGAPLRQVADPDPAGAHFHLGTAAAMAIATATAAATARGDLGRAADELVATHRAIFRPPLEIETALAALVDRLARHDVPAVLQHGDFAVWNILSTSAARSVGILDWENADPAGMPLWDLFVFARTFGVFMADAAGQRYGPAVFRRQLLDDGPLRRALTSAVGRYRDQVDVPADAVDDLFVLCWVQQAVREAATLPRPTWQVGRHNRYVAASLDQPLGYTA